MNLNRNALPVIEETLDNLPENTKPNSDMRGKLILYCRIAAASFYSLFALFLKVFYIN